MVEPTPLKKIPSSKSESSSNKVKIILTNWNHRLVISNKIAMFERRYLFQTIIFRGGKNPTKAYMQTWFDLTFSFSHPKEVKPAREKDSSLMWWGRVICSPWGDHGDFDQKVLLLHISCSGNILHISYWTFKRIAEEGLIFCCWRYLKSKVMDGFQGDSKFSWKWKTLFLSLQTLDLKLWNSILFAFCLESLKVMWCSKFQQFWKHASKFNYRKICLKVVPWKFEMSMDLHLAWEKIRLP